MKDYTNPTVGIPSDVYRRLVDYSHREGRRINWCIAQAVTEWLDEQEKKERLADAAKRVKT